MRQLEDYPIFERNSASADDKFCHCPILVSFVRAISAIAAKSRFLLLIVLAVGLWGQPIQAQVGEPAVEIITRDRVVSVPLTTIPSLPLQIYTSVAEGYDDNFRANAKAEGSSFTSGRGSLSYALARGRMGLSIVAGGGAVVYSSQTNIDGFLDLTLNYAVSHRLRFDLDLSGGYQVEPDFASDAGPSLRAGGFFHTSNILSATYQWSRDWSSVSSYSLRLIRYDNGQTAAVTDRQENTFGEQLRYQWSRSTSLVGEYRFETIDYVTAPRDSETNYLLAGVNAQLSRRLKTDLRAGMSFRHLESSGDTADPHFEGSLDYAAGRDSTVRLTASYSVEETGLQVATSRNTFRTGLQVIYGLTSRVRCTAGFDYHHDEFPEQRSIASLVSGFSEDALAISLSVSYQINRTVNINFNFDHSDVISDQPAVGYSRNRVSVGVGFTF